MWCRSPAPQRWLCLGCWTVRTGSRPPAPPAPETTPEHLTAEQSGKEGLEQSGRARKPAESAETEFGSDRRSPGSAQHQRWLQPGGWPHHLCATFITMWGRIAVDAVPGAAVTTTQSRSCALALTAAISHDAQRRTYRARRAAKSGSCPRCRNQAGPLLPASPAVQIRWRRDPAARTHEAKERQGEEVGKSGRRGREREKEGTPFPQRPGVTLRSS